MLAELSAETAESLSSISEPVWNSLAAAAGYYSSYRWVSGHSSMPRMRTCYVCIRSGSRLVAVAPVWYAPFELSAEYSQQRLRATFGDTGPVAMIGSRRGYRSDWIIASWLPDSERAAVLRKLVNACVNVARQWGLTSTVIPYLPNSATRWLSRHRPGQVCQNAGDEAILDLPAGRFEDYLGTLSGSRRSAVRREMKRLRLSGLTVQTEPTCAGSARWLAVLVAQVEAKYGRRATIAGIGNYLETTVEGDPRCARLFTCRNGAGRVVCALVAYEWHRSLFARMWAADYSSLPAESGAYFNTMFYEPIDYCLKNGLRRIYYGPGGLPPKQSRGCHLAALNHVLIR